MFKFMGKKIITILRTYTISLSGPKFDPFCYVAYVMKAEYRNQSHLGYRGCQTTSARNYRIFNVMGK